MKIIITHLNPDPDAIAAAWLLKRFDPQLSDAEVEFVPAGETYQKQKVDSDANIIHVDTGFGRFDHHDTNERTCAAKKVLDDLQSRLVHLEEDKALPRLVEIIMQDDHFEDCYWPEANNDRYAFFMTAILDGLKKGGKANDQQLIEFGFRCLDGIYTTLKLRIEAEAEIQDKGKEFETKWGKALAIESKNDEVMKVAQKSGFVLVLRKDPDGMVRIKAQPNSKVNLTLTYQSLKKMDPEATWFLHASKKMLLNGSYSNPEMVPSQLSLIDVMEIIKDSR
ncbi:hypothetical protein A2160_05830 [Candidatus Beckwithbacteria bacterium RBG_13_42_9]|uniref:ChrB C-terminal domain-containing protein n=1 Tax=Candidatus Beckwithbacteria bacterium RBG_13_42_9 TaxID=1797457 RepID=A0A1F5E6I4_9BACT|nr:MAG: hypothetical protein A2160_05830 [Candidatus Beckwithbacteria bacterium RBG_13_42_9]